MPQIVKNKRRNWDVDYMFDIMTQKGFTITQPAEMVFEKEKRKSLYGARSPLYGTSYDDEQAFMERTRCDCGAFKGKNFQDEICPLCNTVVREKDVDVEFTGWISTGDENKIINPLYYNLLSSALGKINFTEMIYSKKKVDRDGHVTQYIPDEDEKKNSHPYVGIGITNFKDNFIEITNYFKNKRKNSAKSIELLQKEKSAVFTSHIPIYNTILRPQSSTENNYYFNSIDKHVNPLYNLARKLKNDYEYIDDNLEKEYIIQRIQKRVNSLWKINFELLNGKDGFIRGQILGGSLNYTSRNVIVPDPTLKENEIDLSYPTMLELYKYRIIYYLMKIDNIALAKAYNKWAHGFIYDEKICQIMQHIIDVEGCYMLINRNPTLNYYSLLLMKVRTVRKEDDDYVMTVPLSILPGLNADFDGDILNLIALMNKYIIECFKKFDPVTRMIISRDTGKLNKYFALEKSQLINLHYFCTVE